MIPGVRSTSHVARLTRSTGSFPRESGLSLTGAADRIPAIPALMSNESRETRAEPVMCAIDFDFAGFRFEG
jgi:hypothetical protein